MKLTLSKLLAVDHGKSQASTDIPRNNCWLKHVHFPGTQNVIMQRQFLPGSRSPALMWDCCWRSPIFVSQQGKGWGSVVILNYHKCGLLPEGQPACLTSGYKFLISHLCWYYNLWPNANPFLLLLAWLSVGWVPGSDSMCDRNASRSQQHRGGMQLGEEQANPHGTQ